MVSALLLLSALPLALAAPATESASAFAGSTLSAVYPPPGATITTNEEYFPDAEQVGYPGPTPSMYTFAPSNDRGADSPYQLVTRPRPLPPLPSPP